MQAARADGFAFPRAPTETWSVALESLFAGIFGWLARRLVQEELIAESNDGAQRLYLRSSGRSYLRRPWPLTWAA